jgi:hypothetical protein
MHIYLCREDLVRQFMPSIGTSLAGEPLEFELEGDISLLKFPLCIFDGKFAINISEDELNKNFLKKY